MDLILVAWLSLSLFFLGLPGIYFLYMNNRSTKSWNLLINKQYQPTASILVPAYNEEKTIKLKLENLSKIVYPINKIETIIINDASTDNTLNEVNQYIAYNKSLNIRMFDSKEHLGKTACLNKVLKSLGTDVVIISDADCFWPRDILTKAIPYLSDPAVGAITARELLLNPNDTWVTLSEQVYDSTVQSIRIGESKFHSTIFFQGGFAAYKRNLLNQFNNQTDDSGTALDIIQRNSRAILIPEIGFYTISPTIWRNKVNIKIRRASQLQQLWLKCLKLLSEGKLVIPKKLAIPEICLHLVNPVLLVAIGVLSIFVVFSYPLYMLLLILLISPLFVIKRTRTTIFEMLQSNFILLIALGTHITNKKFKLWKPVQESRNLLSAEALKEKDLL